MNYEIKREEKIMKKFWIAFSAFFIGAVLALGVGYLCIRNNIEWDNSPSQSEEVKDEYTIKMIADFESEEAFNAHIDSEVMPLYEAGKIAELYAIFEGGIECQVIDGMVPNAPEGKALAGYKYKVKQ